MSQHSARMKTKYSLTISPAYSCTVHSIDHHPLQDLNHEQTVEHVRAILRYAHLQNRWYLGDASLQFCELSFGIMKFKSSYELGATAFRPSSQIQVYPYMVLNNACICGSNYATTLQLTEQRPGSTLSKPLDWWKQISRSSLEAGKAL